MHDRARSTFVHWTWMSAALGLLTACGAAGDPANTAPDVLGTPPGDSGDGNSPMAMVPLTGPASPKPCGQGILCWAGTAGPAPTLYKTWGSAASDLWIVGEQGVLLHWSGTGWSVLEKGAMSDLHGVWGSSSTDVWAVGDSGTILHWNGSAWNRVVSPSPVAYYDVWGTGASDVWAVGDNGVTIHWNGTAWAAQQTGLLNRLSAVWGSGSSDVWAVGDWGLILHWNGTAWAQSASNAMGPLLGLWGSGSSDVWAVGADIQHWDGNSWTNYLAGGPLVSDVWGTSSGDVWAAGAGGLLNWNGLAWNTTSVGPGALHGLWSSDPVGWAVGDNGTIVQFDTSSYRHVVNPTNITVYALWEAAHNDVWIGNYNEVQHFDGMTWTPMSLSSGPITDFWGAASNDIWLAAPGAGIFHWNGAMLSSVSIPGTPNFLWGFATDNIWAAGRTGTIYHWNGTMWSTGTSIMGDAINSLWGTSSSDLWAVGGYVWHWNGTSWTISLDVGANVNFLSVSGSGTGDVWAAAEQGCWHYNGTTWAPVNQDGIGRISGSRLWTNAANDVWLWSNSNRLLHWNGRYWMPSASPGTIDAMGGLAGSSDLWVHTDDGRVWHR